MKRLLTIYHFFTRRWDRIKQAAQLVAGLGEELSRELKVAEADPNPEGWLPEFEGDQPVPGATDLPPQETKS